MKKRTLVNILLVFCLLFMLIYSTDAADKYIVRVIYFQPSDAKEVSHATYNKIIKDIQEFFKSEMIRHGFGDKTFKIETNADGTLKIYTVKGRHSGDYYKGGAFTAYYDRVSKEIPFHINNTTNREEQDNIYIVILGGVEVSEHGMTWGGGWTFHKAIGGCAVISETARKLYPHHYTSLIAHEFTHAFGIKHNTDNTSLMGTLPFGGPTHILDFEARLLNKHHLFNDSHILNTPPEITSDLTIRNIDADNISLEAQARSGDDLYHCQVYTGQDYVGSDALHGRSDTIQITVPRGLILNGSTLDGRDLEFEVYDVNGNRGQKTFRNIQLSEPLLEDRDITSIDTEESATYLTLTSNHENAIVPQNSLLEWDGWLGLLWEKTPEGQTPPKPEWYNSPPSHFVNQWDYWFYAVAISRLVYDISDRNYTKFDGYFYMPNPCGSIASVELICIADGKEIYNSGVLRGNQARNKHISFDIPENSETLTITVTDAGDGIACDHFLIANAYLAHSDPKGTQQVSKQSNIKYLALTAENDSSIRAINRPWQWGEHLQSIWEKPFGETLPPKPEGFVHPSQEITDYHTDKWDTFFYSHANSLVIWNISELEYNIFDCYLYIPNPCGDIAAFEIRFLTDYKEIYKIKEARVKDQGKHITFHIPENANLLSLEVFDLGDSACDHYLLANPHLKHVEVYSAPSNPHRTIVTTWGSLKSSD